MTAERTLAVWIPDWPIWAAARELGLDPLSPIALIERGVVFACSPAARSAGVRRGLSQREAQYRAPGLSVLRYQTVIDARRFEPVLRALEESIAGLQVVRPGLAVARARGPVRYYGGEREAAEAMLATCQQNGFSDARAGLADGIFSAEQAARQTTRHAPIRIVEPAQTRAFLAPLPIETVAPDERTAVLLRRLGMNSLGQLAELNHDDVLRRFGAVGAWMYQQASGTDPQRLVVRDALPDFERSVECEAPLTDSEQIVAAVREPVGEFHRALHRRRLVATVLRVELTDDNGSVHVRRWAHPRWFDAAEIVDRVRWQLDGLRRVIDPSEPAGECRGIVRVRVIPERLEASAHHESGLWGGGPDEQIHHAFSRLQGLLGYEAVVTPVLGGGRGPADRVRLVPWGQAAPASEPDAAPWPGSLPGIAPGTVYPEPPAAELYDRQGRPVRITARGSWDNPPARLHLGDQMDSRRITAWAGPWPLVERWWDAALARQGYRAQLLDSHGDAWLLLGDASGWLLEARYD